MDIEEIKDRLSFKLLKDEERGAAGLTQGMLWIIEKLQEVPSVQVLQLGPEDVLVATFERPVPMVEIEHYRNQLEGQFPDNRVVLVEGLALSVVRGE